MFLLCTVFTLGCYVNVCTYVHMSCGSFGEDVSPLNVEIVPLGYPEMCLGLWARKDAEGFVEAMWLQKVLRKV